MTKKEKPEDYEIIENDLPLEEIVPDNNKEKKRQDQDVVIRENILKKNKRGKKNLPDKINKGRCA